MNLAAHFAGVKVRRLLARKRDEADAAPRLPFAQQPCGLEQDGHRRSVIVGARRGFDGVIMRAENHNLIEPLGAGNFRHEIRNCVRADIVRLTMDLIARLSKLALNQRSCRFQIARQAQMARPNDSGEPVDVPA